jgi:glycosyltransferase involved in cell wall biosynthesis
LNLINSEPQSEADSHPAQGGEMVPPACGLVIVPTYNEADELDSLLARIREHVGGDVLVVNDGSSDRTRELLERAGADVLSHPINLGYAEALKSGIGVALQRGCDYCVFLDADGQHDPAEIGRLVESLHTNAADLVLGSRFCRPTGYESTAARRAGMVVFAKLASWFTRQRITDPTSGFKVLSRRAMEATAGKVFGDLHAELLVYLSALGFKIVEEPIQVAPRRRGRSMYGWFGLLIYTPKTLLAMLIAWLEARLGSKSGGES